MENFDSFFCEVLNDFTPPKESAKKTKCTYNPILNDDHPLRVISRIAAYQSIV